MEIVTFGKRSSRGGHTRLWCGAAESTAFAVGSAGSAWRDLVAVGLPSFCPHSPCMFEFAFGLEFSPCSASARAGVSGWRMQRPVLTVGLSALSAGAWEKKKYISVYVYNYIYIYIHIYIYIYV